jgi:hypothetical protein
LSGFVLETMPAGPNIAAGRLAQWAWGCQKFEVFGLSRAEGAFPARAGLNGGGREIGAVGSGLEPQRFADTCGMRIRRAFNRSARKALARSARRWSRRRRSTPTDTNAISTGRKINRIRCIP